MTKYLNTIGCIASGDEFFFVRPDGSVDGTHFSKDGAAIMAGFVGDAIGASTLGLAELLQ